MYHTDLNTLSTLYQHTLGTLSTHSQHTLNTLSSHTQHTLKTHSAHSKHTQHTLNTYSAHSTHTQHTLDTHSAHSRRRCSTACTTRTSTSSLAPPQVHLQPQTLNHHLSSEDRTHKTVRARFWPCLSGSGVWGVGPCRANMAHIRQSGPDSGLDSQVKVLESC